MEPVCRDPPGEYEYWLTVAAADIPTVVEALGGTAADEVLQLLAAHADNIISTGEKTWLESLGITPDFFSRVER